ncbi:MAG: DUF2635 domain-containing protein [Salinisphaera sp.]|jgi:hypothetical protein|nr:DUF2635 domain-containing protein [Salinisphaera sp.]
MNRVHLKPRHGLVVRHPLTGAVLPATGETVEVDGYWRRRLVAGDVYAGRPTPARKSTKPRKKPTEDNHT